MTYHTSSNTRMEVTTLNDTPTNPIPHSTVWCTEHDSEDCNICHVSVVAVVNNEVSQHARDENESWDAALLAAGINPRAPGKRQVKNRSGRQGRKQHHGRQAVQSVGGFSSDMAAIYASNEVVDRFGNTVPRDMCVTVENDRGYVVSDGALTPYRNVGGSTSGQGYIGGRGL